MDLLNGSALAAGVTAAAIDFLGDSWELAAIFLGISAFFLLAAGIRSFYQG